MALPIATLERGTLDSKLAKIIFGDDAQASNSVLSSEAQMNIAHMLIERLADLPRPVIEWHAPKIDRGVIMHLKGPARRLVCEWLREHHPNVCASMPEVSDSMDCMIRAVGYNAWFQPETLYRLERAARAARVRYNGLNVSGGTATPGVPAARGFGSQAGRTGGFGSSTGTAGTGVAEG